MIMDENLKIKALALHFGVDESEISEGPGEILEVESEPGEYAVYTSDERDEAVANALDAYIDDCGLPEIPEANPPIRPQDVRLGGEEDAMIAPYDGCVHEVHLGSDAAERWMYVVRTN